MNFWKKILVNTLGLFLLATILPGVSVSNWISAMVFFVVLSALNAIVKPIFVLFTLPINVISFGLFTFVLNGLMLTMASSLLGGSVYFASFGTTMLVSILLTMFQNFVEKATKE